MFKNIRSFNSTRKGQTTVEYAFIFVIVIGALIAMTLYIKRGIQGRWREAVDSLGDQYDPTNMDTQITHTLDTNIESVVWTEENAYGLTTMRNDVVESLDTRTGDSTVRGY